MEPSAATFSEGVRAASQKTIVLPVVELVVLVALALAPPMPPVTVVAKLPVVVLFEPVTAVAFEVPVPEVAVFAVAVFAVTLLDTVALAVVVAVIEALVLALVDASPEVTLLVVSGAPVVTAFVVAGPAEVARLVAEFSVDVAPPVLVTRPALCTVSLVAAGSSTTVAQATAMQPAACRTRMPEVTQRGRGESR